jgi:hypothetical protein
MTPSFVEKTLQAQSGLKHGTEDSRRLGAQLIQPAFMLDRPGVGLAKKVGPPSEKYLRPQTSFLMICFAAMVAPPQDAWQPIGRLGLDHSIKPVTFIGTCFAALSA